MNRSDYESIAVLLKDAGPVVDRDQLIAKLGSLFALENTRFDFIRFAKLAGMTAYSVDTNKMVQVGFLIAGDHVVCNECTSKSGAPPIHAAPLFRANCGDYRQSCHTCGKQVVEPKTQAWPELYSQGSCQICSA